MRCDQRSKNQDSLCYHVYQLRRRIIEAAYFKMDNALIDDDGYTWTSVKACSLWKNFKFGKKGGTEDDMVNANAKRRWEWRSKLAI